MADNKNSQLVELVYGTNDKPRSTKDLIVYSLQWILIMFYPVVWGYAIVGLGLGFEGDELAGFMGRVVLMIGIATLLQVIYGHGLAMVSGPNVVPSLAIMAVFAIGGKEYALQSFNAYIIAGIIVAIIGATGLIKYIAKIWTNLVLGSMVMMIGLTTSSIGVSMISSYQATWPFYVGIFLALLCGYLSIKGKGILATVPVLITIVLGYAVFMITGKFDWELVNSMPLFVAPKLFPYGFSMPPLDLIIIMIVVNIFAGMMLHGNVSGYSAIVGAKMDNKVQRRYFSVFGIIEGFLTGIFGVPSHVPYAENLGFILLTRIAARIFIIVASIAFIVLSFFGPIGGLMGAMPQPVAGAVLLGVASTLIGIGANIWHQDKTFQTREIFIVGFSIFLAMGISALPQEFFEHLPRLMATILKTPVITVMIFVILLEKIVFRVNKEEIKQGQDAEIATNESS